MGRQTASSSFFMASPLFILTATHWASVCRAPVICRSLMYLQEFQVFFQTDVHCIVRPLLHPARGRHQLTNSDADYGKNFALVKSCSNLLSLSDVVSLLINSHTVNFRGFTLEVLRFRPWIRLRSRIYGHFGIPIPIPDPGLSRSGSTLDPDPPLDPDPVSIQI